MIFLTSAIEERRKTRRYPYFLPFFSSLPYWRRRNFTI